MGQTQINPQAADAAPAAANTNLAAAGLRPSSASGQPASPEIAAIPRIDPSPKHAMNAVRPIIVGSSATTIAVSAPLPARP